MFPPMISNGPGPQQNSPDLSLPDPRLMCEISECGVRAHEGATEVPLGKGVFFHWRCDDQQIMTEMVAVPK